MNNLFSQYIEDFLPLLTKYSINIVLSIIWLVIWWILIWRVIKGLKRVLESTVEDISIRKFLLSFLWIFLKIVLLTSIASLLWLETASLIAALWTVWIALWLALQWSLSNVAWGLLILIFKPFNIGDYIQAQWQEGKVISINVLYTILDSTQHKQITIPNGTLANNIIKNLSIYSTRMIEYTIWIPYEVHIWKAKNVILETISKNQAILQSKEKFVWVQSLWDKSVQLRIRCRTKARDYFEVSHVLLEELKEELEEKGVGVSGPKIMKK